MMPLPRNQSRDDYYFLNEQMLRTFKRLQELPLSSKFHGTPVEQAYWIWRQTPRSMMFALLEANGVGIPPDYIQRQGVDIVEFDETNSRGENRKKRNRKGRAKSRKESCIVIMTE